MMHIKCKNNIDFFWKNVERNQRIDGRAMNDSRNVSICFLREYGHSIVTIGKTKVVCTITGEIVEPLDKKPNEGIVRIHLDTESFNNLIDNSKTNEEGIEIRNIIDKTLKSSKTLNFESLCIIPHKKVWCLYVNLTVIEHDGNICDACFLAAYSSLVHFRKTEIKIDETFKNKDRLNLMESEALPLSVHNIPILSTFAYFEKGDIFMMDPTLYEQELMTAQFSVAINKNGKIIYVLKPGGSPVNYSKLSELIQVAKQRVSAILKILQDAIDEDKNIRNDVKKSNLHVHYSCEPSSILYNEELKYDVEFKNSIPVDQAAALENLLDEYESSEEDGGEDNQNEDEESEVEHEDEESIDEESEDEESEDEELEDEEKEKLEEKKKEKKEVEERGSVDIKIGETGKYRFAHEIRKKHSTSFFKDERGDTVFEQTKRRREGGDSFQEKTDVEESYTSNDIVINESKIKSTQNMMQIILKNARNELREKDDVTSNSEIIREQHGAQKNENEKEFKPTIIGDFTHISGVYKKFDNLEPSSIKPEKEQRDTVRLKRQEVIDGGKLPMNKYLKTDNIDRLKKRETEIKTEAETDLRNLKERHKTTERCSDNTSANNVNLFTPHQEMSVHAKKKRNESELHSTSAKREEEDSSSDVDFSVAINEKLTPKKQKEKQKVKKEKKRKK